MPSTGIVTRVAEDTTPPTITDAASLFDLVGDVILRSTDNVDFRTFKILLSLASGFFGGMFEIQPSRDQRLKDGISVIEGMEADSATLRGLLLFCHPGKAPETKRLHDFLKLAIKYDFSEVAKRAIKERIWVESGPVAPVMLEHIKQNFVQDGDQYLAAEYIIRFPKDSHNAVELGLIEQESSHSLLIYREACSKAASKVAQPWPAAHFMWIPREFYNSHWFDDHDDRNCRSHSWYYFDNGDNNCRKWSRRWWGEYMRDMAPELAKRPDGSIVVRGKLFDDALESGMRCKVCGKDLPKRFNHFVAIFAAQVNLVVSEVRLE